jgi:hypothetical protein
LEERGSPETRGHSSGRLGEGGWRRGCEPKVVSVISTVRELRGDGGQLTVVVVGPGNGGSGSSMWRHLAADVVEGGRWLRSGLRPSLLEEEAAHEGVGGA